MHPTFRQLEQYGLWPHPYQAIAASLGGVDKHGVDIPINMLQIIHAAGLEIGLWVLSHVPVENGKAIAHQFSMNCVAPVLPIFEAAQPQQTWVRELLKQIETSGLPEGPQRKDVLDRLANLNRSMSNSHAGGPALFALMAIESLVREAPNSVASHASVAWTFNRLKLDKKTPVEAAKSVEKSMDLCHAKQKQTLVELIKAAN